MRIQKICNANFKANLFYKGKPITRKETDLIDIKNAGAKATDIFVTDVKSRYDGYCIKNNISFTISNPLFDDYHFKNNYAGVSSDFIDVSEESARDFLYKYFTEERDVRELEDRALENTLLNKIKNAAYGNFTTLGLKQDTSAVGILRELLDENDANMVLSHQDEYDYHVLAEQLDDCVRFAGADRMLKENEQENN